MSGATALTATTHTQSTGITTGKKYTFRIKARNYIGYSAYSNIVEILAASIPATPAAPATALVEATIEVTWTLPDKRGSDITSYKISVQ